MPQNTIGLVLIIVGLLMAVSNIQNNASFQNLEGQSSGAAKVFSGQ